MTDVVRNVVDAQEGLSRLARSFLRIHGVRLPPRSIEQYRERWLAHGIPPGEIDRASDFEARWGGFVLPPSRVYEGGPRYFGVDFPEPSPDGAGWCFEAGDQRASVPFGFVIGPHGEFGLRAFAAWTPLYASIEGWVEALALDRHATLWAENVRQVKGPAVEALDLDGFEPVTEVGGITDQWWRGPDSLIAIHRGEAECLDHVGSLRAFVYSGLDEWGLTGG